VRPTIGSAHHSDWIQMTVDPRSIRHYRYLQECYLKPAFVEKLTIARWSQDNWYVFNVYRNHQIGRDGIYRDTVVFSIIESEWPAVRANLRAKLETRFDLPLDS